MPNPLQPSLSNTPTYVQKTETTGIAPYANDLLQRGQAFTTAETPVYGGQLTTGPSSLQNKAFEGIANLTIPKNLTEAGNQLGNISQQQQGLGYDTSTYDNTYVPGASKYKQYDVQADTFGNAEAQKYMNPYIQQALDPQMEYMRRNAAINQQADMAKLAQAGAFGGSRQAILQGQNQEALGRLQATTAGAGYEKAFTAAQNQFNADRTAKMEAIKLNIDQAKKAADLGMSDAELTAKYGMDAAKANEASKQFGANYKRSALSDAASAESSRASAGANEANYGLQNLKTMADMGGTQRDIDQQALDAQYKEYLRQTEYPGKQLETMKGLITSMAGVMPKTETGYGQKKSALEEAAGGAAGIAKLAQQLGVTPDQIKSVFGIKDVQGAINEEKKKVADPNYGKASVKGTKAPLGTPEGTHRDKNGKLIDDETGKEIKEEGEQETDVGNPDYVTPEGGGMVDDPGFDPGDDMFDPSVESFGEGEYAKGGLIALLHKMRSYQ
jgi:hypothetical protein